MASYEFVVRGGTVANTSDVTRCDVAISAGRIVALGENLSRGEQEIDASRLVCTENLDLDVMVMKSAKDRF